MTVKYILFAIISMFLGLNLTAQNYRAFAFDENNGLSSNNVHDIVEDKFGFIWISTQDGLNKFDGNTFTIYNTTTKIPLSGNDCKDLFYDTLTNILWISTSNGGIDALDVISNKVIYNLHIDTIKNHFDDPLIRKTLKLKNGNLVFGLENGFISLAFNQKNFSAKATYINNNFPVADILKSNGKILFIGYNKKILIYDEGLKFKEEISMKPDIPLQSIISTSFDYTKDRLFICAEGGSYLLNLETLSTTKISFEQSVGIPYAIKRMNNNELIIASTKGVFTSSNNFKNINKINFITSQLFKDWDLSLNRMYVDKNGYNWYGGRRGLFLQERNLCPFVAYSSDTVHKTNLNHLYYLHFLDKANILACNIKGLYQVNLTTKDIVQKDENYLYYYFFEDMKMGKFFSREDGLFFTKTYTKLDLNKAGNVYSELKLIDSYKFATHLKLNDSTIILGTDENKSVYVWNTLSRSIYNINDFDSKVESYYTNGLVKIDNTRFLFVTDSEVAIFNTTTHQYKKVILYNSASKQMRLFLDAAKIKNNYWIASYGNGIFVLDSLFRQKKIINTQNGLSNNGVYKMIFDGKNDIWVTTNYGLNRINESTFDIKSYFVKDGLHSNNFEEYSANIYDGKLIAGGTNGFSLIIPELIQNKTNPKGCIFRYAKLNDGQSITEINLLNQNKLTIPNTIFKADINVVSLNFDLSTNKYYYYKIVELNNNWINNGEKNEISLLGLHPGTYHLQVKAANEDGVWSEPKELILIFLPKWYQTWWFYLLIALTVAAILYALYRYRISQIKKQHEIRKNIATDLHDDLGSTLNSVKVFTNLAISGVKQEESLQQVKDNLTEATMSLRDMIWVLDDSLDTVDELITRLKQFAIPVAGASNIEAIIKADSEVNSRQLIKEEKRNLFLICKEAINNSIKYSGASQIDVTITASGKKIQIAIADNGRGFNIDEVKKGYGLKNMQYRAGQVKYKVTIVSSPGKGTQVELKPA